MKDGITTVEDPFTKQASLIQLNSTTTPASYDVIGKRDIYFFSNNLINALKSEDIGAEMFFTFNRIKALNLDIQLNGSFTKTTNTPNKIQYSASTILTAPERYAVYNGLVTKSEQLNLGSNFNYHLKKVGLILSLRTEHILMMNHNRNQNRYPIGYLDDRMVYHAIPVADQTNTDKYGHLIQKPVKGDESLQRALHNFHLRISKDFLNGFKVSVYTTNVLGLKPTYIDSVKVRNLYPIAEFSLGAKLEYTF